MTEPKATSGVSLNLVVIRSADLERAAAFYTLLGLSFQKHRHGTGPEHLTCEMGQTVFEIYPRKTETDSTASVRLGFRVASVESAIADLQAAGAVIVSPPKDSPWGRRAVVDDPDGHRVELTERL
ncbi:MAG: VOC family protein [Armatimonadota bacterium]